MPLLTFVDLMRYQEAVDTDGMTTLMEMLKKPLFVQTEDESENDEEIVDSDNDETDVFDEEVDLDDNSGETEIPEIDSFINQIDIPEIPTESDEED